MKTSINKDIDFSGVWRSTYHYTSSAREGEFTSEYEVRIVREGDSLIVKSLPNASKSYILVRLSLDGRVAAGTWQEFTSPTGFYEGSLYHGALQLVLDEDARAFRGRYVGYSRNMTVKGGEWELVRISRD